MTPATPIAPVIGTRDLSGFEWTTKVGYSSDELAYRQAVPNVGASDVCDAIGLNGAGAEFQYWMWKRGVIDRPAMSQEQTEVYLREGLIFRQYQLQTGNPLRKGVNLSHPDWRISATPDYVRTDTGTAVDAKCAFGRVQCEADAPLKNRVQSVCQAGLLYIVTGAPQPFSEMAYWNSDGKQLTIVTFADPLAYFWQVNEAVEDRWERYMVRGEMPNPGDAGDYTELFSLATKGKDKKLPMLDASPEAAKLIRQYNRVTNAIKFLDTLKATLRNQLADHSTPDGSTELHRLAADGGYLNWESKSSSKLDREALAADLGMTLSALEALEAKHTTSKVGNPYPKWYARAGMTQKALGAGDGE